MKHYLWGLFLTPSPSFIQVTSSKYGIIIFLHETGREDSHLLRKFQQLTLTLISAFVTPDHPNCGLFDGLVFFFKRAI